MKNSESYYILLPGDTESDCMYESNLLGESDINGSFWPGQGLQVLMKIAAENQELLTEVKIKTDKGIELTVEKFLNKLQGLKIKKNA